MTSLQSDSRPHHWDGTRFVTPQIRLTVSQRRSKIIFCLLTGCVLTIIGLMSGIWLVDGVLNGVLGITQLVVSMTTLPLGLTLMDIAEREALR